MPVGEPALKRIQRLMEMKIPNKNLGQHFLVDDGILSRTVELAEISVDELDSAHILEIGSGPGVLTNHLLNTGARITTIEIDESIFQFVKNCFAKEIETEVLNVVLGDALKIKWPDDLTHIIANIPYQISSPLIERISVYQRNPNVNLLSKIVILVQDDFARRLVDDETSCNKSSLGICTALEWVVTLHDVVNPNSFIPVPKVKSRIISMTPRDLTDEQNTVLISTHAFVRMVVKHCFSERRKKLGNILPRVPRRISRRKGWFSQRWIEVIKNIISVEHPDLPESWFELRAEDFKLDHWLILSSWIEGHNYVK